MNNDKYKNMTEDEAIALLNSYSGNYRNEMSNYEKLPDWLKKDINFNIRALNETEILLDSLTELQNNREVVIAAIKVHAGDLKFASEELKNDKEIVKLAIDEYPACIMYASDEIKNDKDMILYCVSQNGFCLQYANDRLRNDKEVVIAAILNNGESIQYASSELKDDEEIVIMAVKSSQQALGYASDRLRNNKKVVLVALESFECSGFDIGLEIRKEINESGKDPISYLKAAILHEELSRDIINNKKEKISKPKL
jgi:hypothetical protein